MDRGPAGPAASTWLALAMAPALALMLTLAGCGGKPMAERPGAVPYDAQLVAQNDDRNKGLTFVAPEDGQVFYLCNQDLVTTIPVNENDTLQLNARRDRPKREPVTRILRNGERIFGDDDRCKHNRFYFLPADE